MQDVAASIPGVDVAGLENQVLSFIVNAPR